MTSSKRSALPLVTTKIAGLAMLALASLGGQGAAAARPLPEHGTLAFRGASSKALVAGSATVHVYSQFSGGSVYLAPARTGTDADCGAPAAGSSIPVPADRVVKLTVADGQVACVSTAGRGAFELVWHAVGHPARPSTTLARAGR